MLLLLTFRKLLKGQSVLWLKLNKLDLGGEKSWPKASGSTYNNYLDRKTKMSVASSVLAAAAITTAKFQKKKIDHNVCT